MRLVRVICFFLLVIAVLFLTWAGMPGSKKRLVRGVIAPNAIVISTPEGGKKELRLSCLAAPASDTPEYRKGLERANELLYGRMVTVDFDENALDSEGSMLGTVFVLYPDEGKLVNVGVLLVREGWLTVDSDARGNKYINLLNAAQEKARESKLGVWNQ